MLDVEQAMLLIVDVQGNLAHTMHEKEQLFHNLDILIQGGRTLGLPTLLTEQLPDKLGPTLPRFSDLLPDVPPIHKRSFDCCGEPTFLEALTALGRRQVVLAGIEAHVCVYQTARGLLERGYEVHLVSDAISARTAANRWLGLERLRNHGALLSGTEMALYELMREADSPVFREILKLVK
jgi:nicotinamidase-related amidase